MIITEYRSIKRTPNVPLYSNKAVKNNVVNFGAKLKIDKVEPFITNSLNKLGDFSLENYKKLSEAEKIRLREEYAKITTKSDFYKNCEDVHDEVSDAIKEEFDKKYGKGKYVVITIGRSLSSIGKVLGYKIGEENVKNIPMTNTRAYLSDDYTEKIKKLGHIDALNEYLNSIGLNQETIKKSRKKYIIMDYVHTGYSLMGATKLLKSNDVLGASDKIISYDVQRCIHDEFTGVKVEGYLCSSLFKDYSFVDQCKFFDSINDKVVNPKEKEDKIRLMWFKLLDNCMQKQQVKKTDTARQFLPLQDNYKQKPSEKKTNPIIKFFQNLFK